MQSQNALSLAEKKNIDLFFAFQIYYRHVFYCVRYTLLFVLGPSASGTMQRLKKKTYITRPLTVDIARSIGLDQYYIPCRKAFDSILRILDTQVSVVFFLNSCLLCTDLLCFLFKLWNSAC